MARKKTLVILQDINNIVYLKDIIKQFSAHLIKNKDTVYAVTDTRTIAIKVPGATIGSMILLPNGTISTVSLHYDCCHNVLKCFTNTDCTILRDMLYSYIGYYIVKSI